MRLLMLTLLLAAGPAWCATALWRGAEYGMTPERVIAAVPDATAVDEPTIAGGIAGPDLWYRARIAHYALVGHDFRVAFLFRGQGLDRVLVQLNEVVSAADGYAIEMQLNDALLNRYGSPYEAHTSAMNGSMSLTSYKSGPVDVQLARVTAADGATSIEIQYDVAGAAEADKL